MHTRSRLLVLGLFCAIILPFSIGVSLCSDVRGEKGEEFLSILSLARSTFQERTGISSAQRWNQETIDETKKHLSELAREKRQTRLQIRALMTQFQDLQGSDAAVVIAEERIHKILLNREDALLSFAHDAALRHLVTGDESMTLLQTIARRVTVASLGDDIDEEMRSLALSRAQGDLMNQIVSQQTMLQTTEQKLPAAMAKLSQKLMDSQALHVRQIVMYRQEDTRLTQATSSLLVNDQQLQEIKRLFAQEHDDILKLQTELARIDARLRAKAERSLIEMGLRDPRVAVGADQAQGPSLAFSWPVRGPLSATFHDPKYFAHFGVQHEAIDIVTAQGTPVACPADGIVFLVRDGGDTGYTYVLIGHQNGFATLYGHLSKVLVAPGQELKQGDTIGLSGGTPGTPGSGPMTTGPHLHFEVISQGTNIDPLTVLPR